MTRCTRCNDAATWWARLRISTTGATTHRPLCDVHARAASDSEVLTLVGLTMITTPAAHTVERATIVGDQGTLVDAGERPLQTRLARSSARG